MWTVLPVTAFPLVQGLPETHATITPKCNGLALSHLAAIDYEHILTKAFITPDAIGSFLANPGFVNVF